MPEFDISMHGIVVLLDRAYYGEPRHKSPIDVEGTVLAIVDHSISGLEMIKQGRFIELICDAQWNDSTDIHIRWENDQKEWYAGGTMILRRAKISFCSSIWTSNTRVVVDTRPYHELKSNYYQRPTMVATKREPLFTYTDPPILQKTYNHMTHMPYDAMWHKCLHEGVLSWARKVAGGFEWKEDAEDALLQYLSNAEAEAPIPEGGLVINEPPVQEQYQTVIHNDDGDPIEIVKNKQKVMNKHYYGGIKTHIPADNLHKGTMIHEAISTIDAINTANAAAKVDPPTEYKWDGGVMDNVTIKGDFDVQADFGDLTGKWEGHTTPIKLELSNKEVDNWDINTTPKSMLPNDEFDEDF